MTQIYINHIAYPSEYIDSSNEFIKSFYEFNTTLDNNKSINKSNNIRIKIPQYKRIFNTKLSRSNDHVKARTHIANVFIESRGYINHDNANPSTTKGKLLLSMYARYPQFFTMSDEFTLEQRKYLIDNHLKQLSSKFVQSILNEIEYTPISYNGSNIVIKNQHKHIIKLMEHYNIMYVSTYKDDKLEPVERSYMYGGSDDINRLMIRLPFDAKYVNFNSQRINEYGDYVFKYNKHPYGYRKGMTVVKNKYDLVNAIKNSYTNIYIDGDIDVSLFHIMAYNKIYRDGKRQTIEDIKPEYFKTWAIGPNCHKLENLFAYYPYNPCVQQWVFSDMESITCLFEFSGVTNLSGLVIYDCVNANGMFANCIKLVKLPLFHFVIRCNSICRGCVSLKAVTNEFKNSYYINDLTSAFNGCISLKHALNGMTIDRCDIQHIFNGCVSLESAFNNCTIRCNDKLGLLLIFNRCINIRNVFNRCTITVYNTNICHLFESMPLLENVFNGCTFRIINRFDDSNHDRQCKLEFGSTFKGINGLKRVFYNCTFESLNKNRGKLTFTNTFKECLDLDELFFNCKFKNVSIMFNNMFLDCDYNKSIFMKCKCKNVSDKKGVLVDDFDELYDSNNM